MNTNDSAFGRKYSAIAGLSGVLAAVVFAFSNVIIFMFLAGPPMRPPSAQIVVIYSVALATMYFSWSYFRTGRRPHGAILAGLLLGHGVPLLVVGLQAWFAPPAPENIFADTGAGTTILASFGCILGAGLVAELLSQTKARNSRNDPLSCDLPECGDHAPD